MYQYIEHLRKKPDHHKRRVAMAASGVITAAIFFAWISVLLPQNTSQVVAQNERVNRNQETPVGTLKNDVAQAFEAIKNLFSDSVNSISEVNLQAEYESMKSQVESGQIKITPENPQNQ